MTLLRHCICYRLVLLLLLYYFCSLIVFLFRIKFFFFPWTWLCSVQSGWSTAWDPCILLSQTVINTVVFATYSSIFNFLQFHFQFSLICVKIRHIQIKRLFWVTARRSIFIGKVHYSRVFWIYLSCICACIFVCVCVCIWLQKLK